MLDERRSGPRVELALGCTLTRGNGSPIAGRTVEVGSGGMSLATDRPLRVDELLEFDLAAEPAGEPVHGLARVMRQRTDRVYALRFERLGADGASRLLALAGLSRPS